MSGSEIGALIVIGICLVWSAVAVYSTITKRVKG